MRAFNEAFASIADAFGVPLLAFVSFLAALLIALGWYFWPAWLPWNWKFRGGSGRSRRERRDGGRNRFRLGSLRWRLRRRKKNKDKADPTEDEELPPDHLPDLPAQVLALTADELAAQGRYAEAVRERLRAIVRDLVERGLIPPSPGWTVTELAYGAARNLPAVREPLSGAVEVFSRIWYGLQSAAADDDAAMRRYASEVGSVLVPTEPARERRIASQGARSGPSAGSSGT